MNSNDATEPTPDDDATDGTDSDAVVGGGMGEGSAASSVPGVFDSEELDQ